ARKQLIRELAYIVALCHREIWPARSEGEVLESAPALCAAGSIRVEMNDTVTRDDASAHESAEWDRKDLEVRTESTTAIRADLLICKLVVAPESSSLRLRTGASAQVSDGHDDDEHAHETRHGMSSLPAFLAEGASPERHANRHKWVPVTRCLLL